MSVYTTLSTGPRRPGDPDGPQAYHVILLDNGRTKMLGGDFAEMLRCIRCGACMNHCPVYQSIGGHAYGSVYPGPMGSVLTPGLFGLDHSSDLPTRRRSAARAKAFARSAFRCRNCCAIGARAPLTAILVQSRSVSASRSGASSPSGRRSMVSQRGLACGRWHFSGARANSAACLSPPAGPPAAIFRRRKARRFRRSFPP